VRAGKGVPSLSKSGRRPWKRRRAWSALATRVKAAAAALQLTDIAPDDPRLAAGILPALRELRPRLTAESLTGIYAEGHPPGAAVHRRLLRRRLPGRWRAGGSRRRPYAAAVKLARKKQQVKGRVVATSVILPSRTSMRWCSAPKGDLINDRRSGPRWSSERGHDRPALTLAGRCGPSRRCVVQDPLLWSGPSSVGFFVKPDGITGRSFARFGDVAGRNW
jgi:hypothetical protein